MMKIALVGRPNVGKSALFNRICKKRISIVHDEEGTTRDRIYASEDFFGKKFSLIDTGGVDSKSKNPFSKEVLEQTLFAIQEAHLIILIVDGQVGPTKEDQALCSILLKTKKPVLLAVNKIDDPSQESFLSPFFSLGIQDVFPISAIHGWKIEDLLAKAVSFYPTEEPLPKPEQIRISIVGKPNVGKSTLLNALTEKPRSIVSPIAGTTRDCIEEKILMNQKEFFFVDTAGLRKKCSQHSPIEKFADIRTQESIEAADLCLVVLDATEKISSYEKKIIHDIEKLGKGCIFLLNKWDLVKNCRMEHYLKDLQGDVPFFEYCPTLFISAKSGRNLEKIFPLIEQVQKNRSQKFSTPQLNQFIETCLQTYPPPRIQGKRLRIYYMTQLDGASFLLFVNNPSLFLETYKKYLINSFRKKFDLSGTPVAFHLRGKKSP